MKQADIPHTSQNTKMWMQNNAKMNIISLLNNIKKKKKDKNLTFRSRTTVLLNKKDGLFIYKKKKKKVKVNNRWPV